MLEGSLPKKQLKFVLAEAELHQDELIVDWELVMNGLERRHCSRNPKWGPSDVECTKLGAGHGLRRPAFVLRPSRRALRAAQDSCNDWTPCPPCRMAWPFVSAGAHAPHSDETPDPTPTRGSSHSARRLRSLAFLGSSLAPCDSSSGAGPQNKPLEAASTMVRVAVRIYRSVVSQNQSDSLLELKFAFFKYQPFCSRSRDSR